MEKKKQLIIISSVIAVLLIFVVVFALLNLGDLTQKKEFQDEAKFNVTVGDETKTVTMEEYLAIGTVEFTGILDTSFTDPEEVTLEGVAISAIFEYLDFDVSGYEKVELRSLDGYASALTMAEIMEAGNVYLCVKMNGEVLKTKTEGGFGPYMMVVNSSNFSNRWCKYVEEITVK